MTGIYHTPIAGGAAANANTFNTPLGQLDHAVVDLAALTALVDANAAAATAGVAVTAAAVTAEVDAARGGYGDLNSRLAMLVAAGGNISTAVNGVHNAGWTEVVVDSSTGFIAGSYVIYALVGGAIEYNLIADIHSPTQLTLTTPIGAGGIADNAVIAMISASEFAAATVIPHGGTYSPTLPATIGIVSQGSYSVKAYGAMGDKTTDDTAAIQAAIDAAAAAGGGCVLLAGRFLITSPIRLRPKTSLRGNLTAREGPWSATTHPESEIYNSATAGEDAIVICSDETLIDTTAGVRTAIPNDAGGEAAVYATRPYNCSIDNLAITGNALSGHGIRIGDPTDGHPTSGSAFNQYCTAAGYDTRISGCLISQHGKDGIHMSGVPSCRIINNYCGLNERYGLSTWVDANGLLIEGNHIQANKSYGANLVSLWGSSFKGNTVEGNTEREINLISGQGVDISGNYFEGSLACGIYIYYANHGLKISGNRFQTSYGATPQGINLYSGSYACTDITIEDNVAYGSFVLIISSSVAHCERLSLVHNTRLNAGGVVDTFANTYAGLIYVGKGLHVVHDDFYQAGGANGVQTLVTNVVGGGHSFVPVYMRGIRFTSDGSGETPPSNDLATTILAPALVYIGTATGAVAWDGLFILTKGGAWTAISAGGISNTKDHAATLNVYYDAGIHIQNKTAGQLSVQIVAFGL